LYCYLTKTTAADFIFRMQEKITRSIVKDEIAKPKISNFVLSS